MPNHVKACRQACRRLVREGGGGDFIATRLRLRDVRRAYLRLNASCLARKLTCACLA